MFQLVAPDARTFMRSEPTHSRFLLALLGLSLAGIAAPSQLRVSRPVPDQAAQRRAEALVKEVLSEDYARAAEQPSAEAELARALLRQGSSVNDDPTLRYVLLREARDAAARAGEAILALEAVESLSREFAVDAAALKADALLQTEPMAKKGEASKALASAALEFLDTLFELDRYDLAVRLAPALESSGARAEDTVLSTEARRRADEARRLHVEFQRVATLPKDDPTEVASALGRFRALQRGDWIQGLPLLARGADAALRNLAQRDLEAPKKQLERADLGDAWREAAGLWTDHAQTQALLRSAYWYQRALTDAESEEAASLEKRLRDVASRLPEGQRLPGYYSLQRRFLGHQGNVTGVAFDQAGSRFLSASGDRTLRLWDAETGLERRRIAAHDDWVRGVALSPDGRRAVSCGDDYTVRLWDVLSGKSLKILKGHTEWVRAVAFLPDGNLVVSASDDLTLRLWNTSTGKEVRRFTGHQGYVWSVTVARDGRRVLSGSGDGAMRWWAVDSGKELQRFEGHRGNVHAVALSPNNRRALSGGGDGTVRLWDMETAEEVRQFVGHQGAVWCVAFSPDGQLALSGGADGTARLWELASGTEIGRLRGHGAAVLCVAFSADGRKVLTGSADKAVRLWRELSR